MAKAKGIVLFGLVPLLFVAGAGIGSVKYLDSAGNRFFNNGKEITGTLIDLAHALKRLDYAAVEGFYSPDFQGSRLGFGTLKEVALKDGIHNQVFTSDGVSEDRNAAMAEWRSYLGGFDSIDELTLHIHRLDKWGSRDALGASIRFELIGTPAGAKFAGIDRGYFALTFKAGDKGLVVTSASLISGERSIGDAPHFTNVAASAGVDFKNRYYPAFLTQKLKFAMIRYGPGGIAAADYDNDGLYDLFIPDGVESKLFRNLGNGQFEDVTAKAGLAGLDGVSTGAVCGFRQRRPQGSVCQPYFQAESTVSQQRRRHVYRRYEEIRHRRRLLHDGRFLGRLRQRRLPRPLCGPLSRSAHSPSQPRFTPATACRTALSQQRRRHFHGRDREGGRAAKAVFVSAPSGAITTTTATPTSTSSTTSAAKRSIRNNGNGTFTDVTVESPEHWPTGRA